MTSLRRALKRFDEELSEFTAQLGQASQELRRNVENKPVTGATLYRHCLEDLNERLAAIGEELQALEAVSVDAISLEELVGHCTALYAQNHRQIAALELQLQRYGYCDLFAPLPPENPLDMLELRRPSHTRPEASRVGPNDPVDVNACVVAGVNASAAGVQEASGTEWAGSDEEADMDVAGQGHAGRDEALGELTNQLAVGMSLHPPGTTTKPRTVMKAMAPMTAAKARVRSETPSTLPSPEALSPSMRQLLGKYAASGSSGPPSQAPLSVPRRRAMLGGLPMSPAPAYLSPAFQLAALEQEAQLARAQCQHDVGAVPGDSTPPAGHGASALAAALGGSRWGCDATGARAAQTAEQDEAVYAEMTQTARKLADKPSFLEQYRERFPYIVASTERLLDTVRNGQRPDAATLAGPPGSTALAAHALGPGGLQHTGGDMEGLAPVAAREQDGSTTAQAVDGGGDDDTLELRAMLISNSSLPRDEFSSDEQRRSADVSTTSLQQQRREQQQQQTGNACKPLQRAALETASSVAQHHVQQGDSSTLAGTIALQAPVAVQCTSVPAAVACIVPAINVEQHDQQHACTGMPAIPRHAAPAAQGSVQQQQQVSTLPMLRPVAQDEYAALPSFIQGQLPLELLNGKLVELHSVLEQRVASGDHAGFSMADVDALGLGPKGKTFVNSLVKQGRAALRVAFGQPGGTTYWLV